MKWPWSKPDQPKLPPELEAMIKARMEGKPAPSIFKLIRITMTNGNKYEFTNCDYNYGDDGIVIDVYNDKKEIIRQVFFPYRNIESSLYE